MSFIINHHAYVIQIENLYKVHRERVVYAEPRVDSRLKIYSFMENQSWKRHRQQLAALELMKDNELIYSRINKVESSDSRLLCEQREHLRKISVGLQHMQRLKDQDRRRKVDRIQRENKYFRERIKNTKPYYSKKLFDDSFEHHKTFVRGRCVGVFCHCGYFAFSILLL